MPLLQLTYWVVEKYDIFQFNTGSLVNLREATTVDDPARPLARNSLAMVEAKLLERKMDNAAERIERMSTSGAAG